MAFDDEEPPQPPPPPPKRRRWPAFAGLGALLLLAAAAFAFFRAPEVEPPVLPPPPELVLIEDPDGVLSGAMLPLGELLVNLGSEQEFLKTRIVVELYQLELPTGIEASIPRLRDTAIRVIGAKTSAELVTTEGKEALRRELIAAFNKGAAESEQVVQIFFEQYVVQ